MRVVFPHTPENAVSSTFTAICGACGGILVVNRKSTGGDTTAG
jgi:hypothetical protein